MELRSWILLEEWDNIFCIAWIGALGDYLWCAPRFWSTIYSHKTISSRTKKSETSRFFECDLATSNNSCNIFTYMNLTCLQNTWEPNDSYLQWFPPPLTCWQAALECWEWSPQQTHLLEVHLSNKPLGHTVWIQSNPPWLQVTDEKAEIPFPKLWNVFFLVVTSYTVGGEVNLKYVSEASSLWTVFP